MPVNDFLPFATNASANVVPQGEFVTAPWLPGGFVAGIAQSAQLNKVWRQGSFGVAGLTTFVVNALVTQDVLDNGDVGRLASQIRQAIIVTVQNLLIGGSGGGQAPITGQTLITEAPMDGAQYGRQSGHWTQIATTGPGTGGGPFLPLTGGTLYNPGQSVPLMIQADAGGSSGLRMYVLGGAGTNSASIGYTISCLGNPNRFIINESTYTAGNPPGPINRLTIDTSGLMTIPGSISSPAIYATNLLQVGNDSAGDTLSVRGGAYARIQMFTGGQRTWTAGANPGWSGQGPFYGIADELRGSFRLMIDQNAVMIPTLPLNVYTNIHAMGPYLTVEGCGVFNGDFHLAGPASFNGDIYVAGGTNLQSTGISGTGLTIYSGALHCVPNAQFDNNVTVYGSCNVSGDLSGNRFWANNGHIYGEFAIDDNTLGRGTISVTDYQYGYGMWSQGQAYIFGIVDVNAHPSGNLFAYSGTQGQFQYFGGSAAKTVAGPWDGFSDRRLKKDIAPYDTGLKAVRALRPISFKLNGLGGVIMDDRTYHSVDAEEAVEVMPEIAYQQPLRLRPEDTEDTSVWVLNSNIVFWAMLNAIKELAEKVEALESR